MQAFDGAFVNESVPLIFHHPTPPVHSLHLSSHPVTQEQHRKIDLSKFHSVFSNARGDPADSFHL